MLVPKLLTGVNIPSIVTGKLRVPSSTVSRKLSWNPVPESGERPERKLKEWRNIPAVPPGEEPWWKIFDRPSKKKKKYVLLGTKLQVGPIHIGRWWEKHKVNFVKFEQQFRPERHGILGCDLAAAHFLVHRGGKVKFLGEETWRMRDKEGEYKLPEKYDPQYQITHLDASGIAFYYEGIENFQNLSKVTWASFNNNPYLDDWCVDKIVANFQNVQHLDISGCKNVSERGLTAIYKLEHLRKLIVTDFHKKTSFELTCIMLEECMPNLYIEIREPQDNIKKDEKIG